MKRLLPSLLMLTLIVGCADTQPTALQGKAKLTGPQPAPPPLEDILDPQPTQAAPTVAESPEERRARLERLRDSMPRVDATSPEGLIRTMAAWERVLRPEVMDAVRLGLMVLPIKLQDRLVQTARANGRMPQINDQELFRQAYGEVHGLRYDEFLMHVQPLITQYEEQLRNPAALTNPQTAAAGAGPVPGLP